MSAYGWFKETQPRYQGARFGIELEIEGDDSHDDLGDLSNHFMRTTDGSLRNGIELVSSPLTLEQAQRACSSYTNWCRNKRISLSPRCSTHIHVNIQDMSVEQLRSMVWLSIALEPVLLRYCSALRNHNTYTVPVYNSVNLVPFWRDLLRNIEARNRSKVQQQLTSGCPKYCAVAAFRMFEYGTLEFRMFPGCKDGTKLLGWIRIIDSIRTLAMENTVSELRDRKVQDGVRVLLTEQLISMRKSVSINELYELTEKGIEMANDITRSVRTLDDLLSIHASLFPEAAPFRIIAGSFWRPLVQAKNDNKLTAFLSGIDPSLFLEAYRDRNRLADLFRELSANTDPVTAADIIIETKQVWSL